MRKIAEVKNVLGQVGDRIEDGPLGAALREFAELVTDYLDDPADTSLYASAMASVGMDIGHLVIDLLESLGLVHDIPA